MARKPLAAAALALGLAAGAAQGQVTDLVSTTHFRVCADPANMPFSNKEGEGFENKIAELLAEKLGKPLQLVEMDLQFIVELCRDVMFEDRRQNETRADRAEGDP